MLRVSGQHPVCKTARGYRQAKGKKAYRKPDVSSGDTKEEKGEEDEKVGEVSGCGPSEDTRQR